MDAVGGAKSYDLIEPINGDKWAGVGNN